jgi:aminoglycoside phosphotransferase (APT) family kinase protein
MSNGIPVGTRVVVDAAMVSALIADQFPQFAGLSVRKVDPGGWDNHTFHLGDSYKVRLPASVTYLSQTDKETTWLPRLAPFLPFAVPVPVAVGQPGYGYPFSWSIWEWIDGETARRHAIGDLAGIAEDVARFLSALASCDTLGAPSAGSANFFRAGDLNVYDRQARDCLDRLYEIVDTKALLRVWEEATDSKWPHPPQWVHGDIAWGNLLVRDGRLHAVIDFGSAAIGDPACDLVINWTLFDAAARSRFRQHYAADPDTWARARGWCVWKATLVLAENPQDANIAQREIAVLQAVLDDLHK